MNHSGRITWRSPSNIALVKYWGKRPGQLPANPSLSMTLERAHTITSLAFAPFESAKPGSIQLDFWFDGEKNEKFKEKIHKYLLSRLDDYPILSGYALEIHSSNTFPHSTGIASSASGMSAFCLCLSGFLVTVGKLRSDPHGFYREASRLSRLASGSACRSVYGGFTVWGEHELVNGSSDEYAVPLETRLHHTFRDIRDAILVVSSREKSVTSRAGHSLMDNHPFAMQRYQMARQNLTGLLESMKDGDMEKFADITEMEAMVLHGLMMSSSPSYFLFEPNTVNIVKAVRQYRKDSGIPVCFTLDAGPNVHLLYPGQKEEKVKDWIQNELLAYCQDGVWIDDRMGKGPEELKDEK